MRLYTRYLGISAVPDSVKSYFWLCHSL